MHTSLNKSMVMEHSTFYMATGRRIAFAVSAFFMSALCIGFLWVVGPVSERYSMHDIFQFSNLFFLIFLIAAIYFTFRKKIPLIKFEHKAIYYNSAILKEDKRDGALFPVFPYFYTSLSESKRFSDLEKIEQRDNITYIYKKLTNSVSRNPLVLQLGAFSKADQKRIIDLIDEKLQ